MNTKTKMFIGLASSFLIMAPISIVSCSNEKGVDLSKLDWSKSYSVYYLDSRDNGDNIPKFQPQIFPADYKGVLDFAPPYQGSQIEILNQQSVNTQIWEILDNTPDPNKEPYKGDMSIYADIKLEVLDQNKEYQHLTLKNHRFIYGGAYYDSNDNKPTFMATQLYKWRDESKGITYKATKSGVLESVVLDPSKRPNEGEVLQINIPTHIPLDAKRDSTIPEETLEQNWEGAEIPITSIFNNAMKDFKGKSNVGKYKFVFDNEISEIKYIGEEAFYQVEHEEIILPDSIICIDRKAFSSGLEGTRGPLKKVGLPENIVSIGYGAFFSQSISSLVFPDSLEWIQSYAFSGNLLTEVIFSPSITKYLKLGLNVFEKNKITKIFIPQGRRASSTWHKIFFENPPMLLKDITLPKEYSNPEGLEKLGIIIKPE